MRAVPIRFYERYVAIGDSSTEGLDDPDGRGGYRGWANRLADRIAAAQREPLLYANLAVRGLSTRRIRHEQLDRALAMRPDLVTLFSGTNDVVRLRFDVAALEQDVLCMQRSLIAAGATVLTFTLPDLSPVLPLARPLAGRIRTLNDALRTISATTGAVLVDFARHAVGSDPRIWSPDRLHANADGHARIAAALAWALGLPGSDEAWALPLPMAVRTRRERFVAELAWIGGHLLPWLWRHGRGRSTGDGRTPKRPLLEAVSWAGLITGEGSVAPGQRTTGLLGAGSDAAGAAEPSRRATRTARRQPSSSRFCTSSPLALKNSLVPADVRWSASVSLSVWLTVTQPAKKPGETGRLGLKPGVPGRFAGVSKRISATIR